MKLLFLLSTFIAFSVGANTTCRTSDYYCDYIRDTRELLSSNLDQETAESMKDQIITNKNALDNPDMATFYSEAERDQYRAELDHLIRLANVKIELIACGAAREAAFMEGLVTACSLQRDSFGVQVPSPALAALEEDMRAIEAETERAAHDQMVESTGRNVFINSYKELARHYMMTGQEDELSGIFQDEYLEDLSNQTKPCISRREHRGGSCSRRGQPKISLSQMQQVRDEIKSDLIAQIQSGDAPSHASVQGEDIRLSKDSDTIRAEERDRVNDEISLLNDRLEGLRATVYSPGGTGFLDEENEVVVDAVNASEYQGIKSDFNELMASLGNQVFDRSVHRTVESFPDLCDGYNGPNSNCSGSWQGTEDDSENDSMSFPGDAIYTSYTFDVQFTGSIRPLPRRCAPNCGYYGAYGRMNSSLSDEVENGLAMLRNDDEQALADAVEYNPSVFSQSAMADGRLSDVEKGALCTANSMHQEVIEDEDARALRRQRMALACGIAGIPLTLLFGPGGSIPSLACAGLTAIGAAGDMLAAKNDIDRIRSALVSGTGFSGSQQELMEREQEFNAFVAELVLELGFSMFEVADLLKYARSLNHVEDITRLASQNPAAVRRMLADGGDGAARRIAGSCSI